MDIKQSTIDQCTCLQESLKDKGFHIGNDTVDVQKFRTLVACQKRPRQTAQTQIRLLLKNQSDQGLISVCYSDKHL